jgi:hypothetical protein
MFAETGTQHHVPHIHIYYQDNQAVYSINPVQLIAGTLPNRQKRFVEAWIELYQEELSDNWQRIEMGEPVNKIPPLQRV